MPTKGQKHVQDEHTTNENNNNNSQKYSTSTISETLYNLSFERDLRTILNSFITPDNIIPPINSYEFCLERSSFLDGNFNVYLATGDEDLATTMMANEENHLFRVLEMPFVSESQLHAIQDRDTEKFFRYQKYVFINKIIELADLIFQELKFNLAQVEIQEILKNEFEFFIKTISNADKRKFPLKVIETKFEEWLCKFPQLTTSDLKEFQKNCRTKLDEILKIGKELAKLSKERQQKINRQDQFHFVEFKQKGLLHSGFSQVVYNTVTNFAAENLSYICNNQDQDRLAIIKFQNNETIYIAYFQLQRLKALPQEEKVIKDWLSHIQHLLMQQFTPDQKRAIRFFAKKLACDKKISSEKNNLISLTFNLYELLQYSEQFPVLKDLLNPRKHFLFLHSHKFCQLFPMTNNLEKADEQKIESACKEVGALQVFYEGLDSYFEGKSNFPDIKLLATIMNQEIWAIEEPIRALVQRRLVIEEKFLPDAHTFLEAIHPEKYQSLLRNIYNFFDRYFVTKSEAQFNFYFEKFRQMLLQYIGRVTELNDDTEKLINIASQSLIYAYYNAMLVHEAFLMTMRQFDKNIEEIEEALSVFSPPKLTRKNSSTSISLPFIGSIGTRNRSLTTEDDKTKKSDARKLSKKPGTQSASSLPGFGLLTPNTTPNSSQPNTSSSDSEGLSDDGNSSRMREGSSPEDGYKKLTRGYSGSHSS